MNQSFNMVPPTTTDSNQHVLPWEQMTKEQQAVVDRYRGQQGAKSNSVQRGPELVYSAEQRRAL